MERFTCSRDRKTGVVLVAVCEPVKDARFSRFSWGLNRAWSRKINFSNFSKNERAVELLIVIFENSSPKGTFRWNKMKSEISCLSWDFWYLRSVALKKASPSFPGINSTCTEGRSSWLLLVTVSVSVNLWITLCTWLLYWLGIFSFR